MHQTITRIARTLLILTALPAPVFAGPLIPPAGPVAPTAKPLAEMEPGIALNPTNTPGNASTIYRITQPGSYYLTGNLTGSAGKTGIEVAADNVTIDLRGFVLTGVPNSVSGISADIGFDGTTVRNGTITAWGISGVYLQADATLINVNVRASQSTGIRVTTGAVIDSCAATNNAAIGISAGDRSIIRGCVATGNGGLGIRPGVASRVERCVAHNNAAGGFSLSSFTIARECTAFANTGPGFETSDQASIFDCNAYDNSGAGFDVTTGVVVSGCTATSNDGPGIVAAASCRLEDNTCRLNGNVNAPQAGIRITGSRTVATNNITANNAWGIKVEATLCLIKGNSSSSNSTANYDIVAGNRVATIVNLATSPAISGNSGGTAVPDPDSNFAY